MTIALVLGAVGLFLLFAWACVRANKDSESGDL